MQGSGEIKKVVGVSVHVLKEWTSDCTESLTVLLVRAYRAKPAQFYLGDSVYSGGHPPRRKKASTQRSSFKSMENVASDNVLLSERDEDLKASYPSFST